MSRPSWPHCSRARRRCYASRVQRIVNDPSVALNPVHTIRQNIPYPVRIRTPQQAPSRPEERIIGRLDRVAPVPTVLTAGKYL